MGQDATTGAAAAVKHVAAVAGDSRQSAMARLASLGVDLDRALRAIDDMRARSRLTLNFHPDRRDSAGRTVAAGLLADGRYRSQFETGISNGGRTAVPGGDRTRWETNLFGGAYDHHDSSVPRPAYGALDVFNDPYGGSPRFGSSFLVLRPSCFPRATFCMGDSHLGPRDVGTADQMMSVLAGALESSGGGAGFGRNLTVDGFLQTVGTEDGVSRSARELDRYIEVQIHGPIELASDVSAIHLDPSFAGTDTYRDLQAAAERYAVDLLWSEGSQVSPEVIEPGFRGPEIAALAHRTVGNDGLVDAAAIGQALVDLPFVSPPPGGDDETSALQQYKKLWHCCLKFGAPPPPPKE